MKKRFKELKEKDYWLSILLLLGGQSFLYVLIKHFQFGFHTFDFAIDDMIPFVPPFVLIYNLFYPFLFVVFYLLYKKDKKAYDKAVIAGTLGYIICNIIFVIYPVEMIRPNITNLQADPLTKLVLTITYNSDNPAINCFPSIHCLFCFQTVYALIRCKDMKKLPKVLLSLFALVIVISIFFVKQHYVVDMIAAFIIVILCNLFIELIYDKIKKTKK